MAITGTKNCTYCGFSGPLNILKIKQPGYGNQLQIIMSCPSCKRKLKGITTLDSFNAKDVKESIERCLACNSPNVDLVEDPLRTYQRYQNVTSLHVKLKYRCRDCRRQRIKIVPMIVMRKMFEKEETVPMEKIPPKPEVLDTCPFCGVALETSTENGPNFCDSCGQNLKCNKCGAIVVAAGSRFCMSCGSELGMKSTSQSEGDLDMVGTQCPQCGSDIREGASFCAECGEQFACDCGHLLEPGSRFCGGCGKPTETD